MDTPITKKLDEVLAQLEVNVPGVEATAIFNSDGLVVASRLPRDVNEEIIGAMSAAILSIGNRSGEELNRGTMQRIFIEGDLGSIVIISVGDEVVLVALINPEVKLGMLFLQFKRSKTKIMEIL